MTTQAPARPGTNLPAPVTRDATPIEILERVIVTGDLAQLTPQERVALYARTCESLGLNPLTRPFEYISLNNKLTLYVRKDATEQLRRINGVSVTELRREKDDDLGTYTVYARGVDRTGRQDEATGVVTVKGLGGEALANALMKAETKAKRRMTLSLVGLGFLDEIEVEGRELIDVDPETGEIRQAAKPASLLDAVQAQRARLESGSSPPTSSASTAPVAAAVAPSDGTGEAGEAPPSATGGQPAAAAVECGDEDASPMGLGFCGLAKGHVGPMHKSKSGTWPR